jgi:hypothetical protein
VTATKRRLAEHITDALTASARRVLAQHPERQEELAQWIETAHQQVVVGLDVGRTRRGRIRTNSLRVVAYLNTTAGMAPLCSVRVRDLVDEHGQPIDPRATARELLWQHGIGIPDDPSGLTGEQ